MPAVMDFFFFGYLNSSHDFSTIELEAETTLRNMFGKCHYKRFG